MDSEKSYGSGSVIKILLIVAGDEIMEFYIFSGKLSFLSLYHFFYEDWYWVGGGDPRPPLPFICAPAKSGVKCYLLLQAREEEEGPGELEEEEEEDEEAVQEDLEDTNESQADSLPHEASNQSTNQPGYWFSVI